jgi:hypothetical protein
MPKITSYRDLEAWRAAMDLADLVYDITDKFPESERFGLVFQLETPHARLHKSSDHRIRGTCGAGNPSLD